MRKIINSIKVRIALIPIIALCIIIIPFAALALANEKRKDDPGYEYTRW